MSKPERSPAQTFLLGSLLVGALLLAFALSFWAVSRGNLDWHNRAQTQVRSPGEEFEANKDWDPNRLLGGFNRQMPEADSWAENFGKPLAYTKGIDADTYLYPPGTAPEPGSLILGDGDEIVEGEGQSQSSNSDSSTDDNPRLIPRSSSNVNSQTNRDNSPVGGLLNR